MKTTFRSLAAAVLFLITGTGFAQEQGNAANTETIKVSEQFDAIEASGIYNITLIAGTEQLVRAESNEDIKGKIKANVKGSTLEVEVEGVPQGKVKFYVTFTKLNRIEASGASTITAENTISAEKFELEVSGASKIDLKLDVKNLNSEITGASKVKLAGKSQHHNLEISGAAKLNSFDMESAKANVEVTGAAVARINVKDEVNGETSGAAKLLFNKEPAVRNIEKSGVSNVYLGDSVVMKTEEVEKIIVGDRVMTINKDGVVIEGDTAGGESMVINEDGVKMIVKEINNGENKQSEVLVINSDGVKIIKKDGKTEKHLIKKDSKKFNGHWDGFELGVNGFLTADNKTTLPKNYEGFDLKMEKSINVRINFLEQNVNLIKNHLGLVTGLGLNWVNYRFDNNIRLSNTDGYTSAKPENIVGTSYKKSKLVVNYLVLPVFLEYQTNSKANLRSFHLAGGMEFGLKIGSHTKIVYNDGKDRKEKERDGYNLNPFKADATVRVGWGKLNLYGTYAMTELFKAEKGPQLYPYSVGISFSGM
jgi:hypothetical protein